MTVQEKYNIARQIADFLIEGGHCVDDVVKEFRITKSKYQEYMRFLATYGYDEELRKNQIIYLKTRTALYNEAMKRRREKKRG